MLMPENYSGVLNIYRVSKHYFIFHLKSSFLNLVSPLEFKKYKQTVKMHRLREW